MPLFIILIVLFIIRQVGLYKIFEKAGIPGWNALVPVLYTLKWLDMLGRPRWQIVYALIPAINIIFSIILSVDLAKAFKRYQLADHAMATFVPFAYFPILGFNKNRHFFGADYIKMYKPSKTRSWIDNIAFAVIAATIIRTYVFESYTIPTPSMEETLLVNDYLFVSKIHFGPRIPMTPLAFPLAHNVFMGGKSYIESIEMPYMRLPGIRSIKLGDIVVFNYPDDENNKPIDRKENYIKRCVAIHGQKYQLKEGVLYIDDKRVERPVHSQMQYRVFTDGNEFDLSELHDIGVVTIDGSDYIPGYNYSDVNTKKVFCIMRLTDEQVPQVKKLTNVKSVDLMLDTTFSVDNRIIGDKPNWNADNVGPFIIPYKGYKVALNEENFELYRRSIRYEGNTVEGEVGAVLINGKLTVEYTFLQDHYFMMGDNRTNSLDSRYWGTVPENHIVGMPLMIWMSYDREAKNMLGKVRWNRLLRVQF